MTGGENKRHATRRRRAVADEDGQWPTERSYASAAAASLSSTSRPHFVGDSRRGGGTARQLAGEECGGGSRALQPLLRHELAEVKCGLELEVIVELPIHWLSDASTAIPSSSLLWQPLFPNVVPSPCSLGCSSPPQTRTGSPMAVTPPSIELASELTGAELPPPSLSPQILPPPPPLAFLGATHHRLVLQSPATLQSWPPPTTIEVDRP